MPAARSRSSAKSLSRKQREAREKAIVSDIKRGTLPYRAIAEKHSVSLQTVTLKARKFGIGRRGAGKSANAPVTRGRTRAAGSFSDDFRSLLLQFHPDITLVQFERLQKHIDKEIG